MKNLRALVYPALLLAGLWLLSDINVNFVRIAHCDFLLDALIGVVLGIVFAVIPSAGGFGTRRAPQTSMLWLPAFVMLVLLFYQYAALTTGFGSERVRFLLNPTTRLRVVEGAALGYCVTIACRTKL